MRRRIDLIDRKDTPRLEAKGLAVFAISQLLDV
jgi:hypothetical protein